MDDLVDVVVGSAYEVSNTLGCGFLGKVYQRALVRELAIRGVQARQQVRYHIEYKGFLVGEYVANLVVESQRVAELKCVECFTNEHIAQTLNYLKASNLHLALLINFQHPKVEWRRLACRF